MTAFAGALPFPHRPLTRIEGKPDNATIKRLKREVYANARVIPSNRGGGANGHLGLVMDNAAYTTRAGVPWTEPAHPGPSPVHQPFATPAQIAKNNRQFQATLDKIALIARVRTKLRTLIIKAVDQMYIEALEDKDWGFANVSIPKILAHLDTKYGEISRNDLECNRDQLKLLWNPDAPMEQLWKETKEIQRFAAAGGEAITKAATMELLVGMFQKTGLMDLACDTWKDKDNANKTWPHFEQHFDRANKRRLEELTMKQASYHGANAAQTKIAPEQAAAARRRKPTPPKPGKVTAPQCIVTNEEVRMYYCWTHGLGLNAKHTSPTCSRRAEGHQEAATATNRMGGNDRIVAGRRKNAQE